MRRRLYSVSFPSCCDLRGLPAVPPLRSGRIESQCSTPSLGLWPLRLFSPGNRRASLMARYLVRGFPSFTARAVTARRVRPGARSLPVLAPSAGRSPSFVPHADRALPSPRHVVLTVPPIALGVFEAQRLTSCAVVDRLGAHVRLLALPAPSGRAGTSPERAGHVVLVRVPADHLGHLPLMPLDCVSSGLFIDRNHLWSTSGCSYSCAGPRRMFAAPATASCRAAPAGHGSSLSRAFKSCPHVSAPEPAMLHAIVRP